MWCGKVLVEIVLIEFLGWTFFIDGTGVFPCCGAGKWVWKCVENGGMSKHVKKCPVCAGPMVRNGRSTSGEQRWLCKQCKTTSGWRNDNEAKWFKQFLDFISGKVTYADMPGQGRSFRRKTSKFWDIWPVSLPVEQRHRVIHVDGIHLKRSAVVLIAYSGDGNVVAWHVAASENTRAYCELLAKIPAPQIVVADGGSGFASARKEIWPTTVVQRCTFHVQAQLLRYTTRTPRTLAGAELLQLAHQLGGVRNQDQQTEWVVSYHDWCMKWKVFLNEKTKLANGKIVNTHERLVKAKNLINRLIKNGELFRFLDPNLYMDKEIIGSLPKTNNPLEGGVNTQLRAVLRAHRGMGINHQIRAICWWLYLHTENPLPPAQTLKIMPTNKEITKAYELARARTKQRTRSTESYIQWHELHIASPYRTDY